MVKVLGKFEHFTAMITIFLSGVEKNNNDAKRNYFFSNLHDITGQVLKAEWRLEQTETCKRTKCKYTKRDKTTGKRESEKHVKSPE